MTGKEKSIDEVHDFACHGCGFVHSEKVCPSCGMERKPKKSGIVKIAGELEEIHRLKHLGRQQASRIHEGL